MQQMTIRMPDELAEHIADLVSLERDQRGARNAVLVRLLQLGVQVVWDDIEAHGETRSSAKT